LLILMIIGASPSGTGGGIKSTTVSSIIGIIKSVFSSHKEYINYHIPITKQNAIEEEKKSVLSRFIQIFSRKHDTETDQTISDVLVEDDSEKVNNELNKILGDIFKIKLLGRTIPFDRIIHAIATFAFYFIILFIGVLFLLLSEQFSFEQIFFEAASGLGTVGLSTGITGQLTVAGKIIITILMFIGRLGPITFGVFLFSRKSKKNPIDEHEDLVI
ncbi:MAG: TrkH family potassium uptake protein, partial [Bacteroidales bacterium]|nr:TrkH family potassium uptake protein [Bacteroidales bacterium]